MKVLYFSNARAASGCGEEKFALGEAASLDEVWRRLGERHPALATLRGAARLSCNDAYADDDTIFQDGDVVAVIPPVSGG